MNNELRERIADLSEKDKNFLLEAIYDNSLEVSEKGKNFLLETIYDNLEVSEKGIFIGSECISKYKDAFYFMSKTLIEGYITKECEREILSLTFTQDYSKYNRTFICNITVNDINNINEREKKFIKEIVNKEIKNVKFTDKNFDELCSNFITQIHSQYSVLKLEKTTNYDITLL